MSCLAVFRRRLGGALVSALRVGGMRARSERASRMTCRMGLVCGSSLGVGFLYASDELLLTIEDGKLIVKRKR